MNRYLLYFPRYLLNRISSFRCVRLWLGAIWLQQRSPRARHVTSPSSVWRWESPPSCSAPYSPLWSSSPLSTTMTTGSPREPRAGRTSHPDPRPSFQSVFCFFCYTAHFWRSRHHILTCSPKYSFTAICPCVSYKIVWRYDKTLGTQRIYHVVSSVRSHSHQPTWTLPVSPEQKPVLDQ